MSLNDIVKGAILEYESDTRRGDRLDEVRTLREYIKGASNIVMPNKDGVKVDVLNKVMARYGLSSVSLLDVNTNSADYSRMPALTKAFIALDQCDADVVVARGRLGLPGSGSFLVFLDYKGRILTAGMSSSHVVHNMSLEDAVEFETVQALEKIGFKPIV